MSNLDSCLERSRERSLAVGDGFAKIPGPGDELLEEVLDALDELEARFEGLD